MFTVWEGFLKMWLKSDKHKTSGHWPNICYYKEVEHRDQVYWRKYEEEKKLNGTLQFAETSFHNLMR